MKFAINCYGKATGETKFGFVKSEMFTKTSRCLCGPPSRELDVQIWSLGEKSLSEI